MKKLKTYCCPRCMCELTTTEKEFDQLTTVDYDPSKPKFHALMCDDCIEAEAKEHNESFE